MSNTLIILGNSYEPAWVDACGPVWEFGSATQFHGRVTYFSDGTVWELQFLGRQVAHGDEPSPKEAAKAVNQAAKKYAQEIVRVAEMEAPEPGKSVWDRLLET